jgi:5-methylcytosine-specific restriction endonuclease McrA
MALDVSPYGGDYLVLKKAIQHYRMDISHFSGQAWNRGKTLPPRRPVEDYLANAAPIRSFKLHKRLLRERLLEHRCSNCNNTTWLDRPIPLELDHISGDRGDNRLENLRLLCPNCHALTPTYRRKNKRKA